MDRSNLTSKSPNEIAQLRAEVASLHKELAALRQLIRASSEAPGLQAPESQAPEDQAPEDQSLLSLRCASLQIVDKSGRVVLELCAAEHGGELRLYSANGGQTRVALQATEMGASLALCGEDGVPRVVLQSREEGGGLSLLSGEAELGAELWGASEASWLTLLQDGRTAVVSIAAPDAGGNLQIFDDNDKVLAALPSDTTPLHSPE